MAATRLEDRTVSRKTPGDGKLEITQPVAMKLGLIATTFPLATPAGAGTAELQSQPCTCRGADNPHEHWFLVSPLFRSLNPRAVIGVSLDERKIVIDERG